MRHVLVLVLPIALAFAGCGKKNQEAASPAAEAPAASAPAEAPASAPAATGDEVVTYDPIDTSKLQQQWWGQFSQ